MPGLFQDMGQTIDGFVETIHVRYHVYTMRDHHLWMKNSSSLRGLIGYFAICT